MTGRLTPSEEHEQLGASVRAFLSRNGETRDVLSSADPDAPHDPAGWRRAAEQLDLPGLELPEVHGGSGASFREVAVVLEELGRSLACLPYFATVVLGAGALLLSGDEQACATHLPGIAAGTTTVAVAVAEEDGSWEADAVRATGTRSATGWLLDGRKSFVVDGASADLLLVLARTASGLSLFAVPGDAPGLARSAMRVLDPTRRQAALSLTAVPAVLVGAEGGANALLERLRDRASVALACEQLGAAQRTLEMAVEHAKTRLQFGRPIGSFQAVKHRCADMAQAVEQARSAAAWAVACAADGDPDLPVAAAMAAICCSEALLHTSGENVQVHGGLGFTWEHTAHLYVRRARTSATLVGDPARHRERLLQLLGV